jgi:hypothetical protein
VCWRRLRKSSSRGIMDLTKFFGASSEGTSNRLPLVPELIGVVVVY